MGIALNSKTSWREIKKFIPFIKLVLIFGVRPGFSGQKFQPKVLNKIKSLRQVYPSIKIEIDGGINLEIGKKCLKAGADILVSGSYILRSKNIKEAIEKLKNI